MSRATSRPPFIRPWSAAFITLRAVAQLGYVGLLLSARTTAMPPGEVRADRPANCGHLPCRHAGRNRPWRVRPGRDPAPVLSSGTQGPLREPRRPMVRGRSAADELLRVRLEVLVGSS